MTYDVELKKPIDTQAFIGSSNLVSGLYDYGSWDLYIRFYNKRIYVYMNVPPNVWDKLKSANSHGSYHYHNIRMAYYYEELTLSDWPQTGRSAPHNDTTVKRFLS